VGIKIEAAEEARAARDGEGDKDPIALLELGDLRPDLLDDAHELVAEDHGSGLREKAVVNVEIRAANGRERDADDGVGSVLNLGIGDVFDTDVGGLVEYDCLHGFSFGWKARMAAPAP
jgi:hypothetical protein